MISKLQFTFSLSLVAGFLTIALTVRAEPPPAQNLVLKSTSVDVTEVPTPGRDHAPVNVHRHFANPSLLGEVKANLAATRGEPYAKGGGGGGGQGGGGGHGKPTPTPSSSPSATPSSTPTPTQAPISSGVNTAVPSLTSFGGMNLYSGGGYIPPDTTIAAGLSGLDTLVLEAVNSLASVYDSTGSLLVNLNFAACTTNTSTDSVSDPRVLFDTDSGRWFISTTTFSPSADASWNLLFSVGSDPTTATWACLVIPTSAIHNPDGSIGNFPDFPKTGINSDKIVLTGNAFSSTSSGYKFQGTEFVVINKTNLLAGTVNAALFPPNQGDVAIEPAQQINSSTDSLYMAAVNSNLPSTSAIDVWTINGEPGGSLSATITSLPIGTISYPPNATQKGTSLQLDTNDDSLLDAVFRQGSGSLWVSANDACTPPGDTAVRSCLRFIQVSVGAAAMSVAQDFDYGDIGTDYYYPAVRTDNAGNLYAAFSGSSASTYPSAYAGMQLIGASNALTNLSITRAGDYPYTISPPRWGDYSGAGVDPNDSSVWLGAEYATSAAGILNYWGTSIAHVSP